MADREKIMHFYSSGRYECDYDFHVCLLKTLKILNLYEWESILEKQIQLIKKIKDMSEANSNSLEEDFDEDQAVDQTHKIKNLLNNINTKDVKAMVEQCEKMQWEPYSIKVYKLLSGKQDYLSIIDRIRNNIHSEQFRIDSMIFLALFSQVNGSALNQFIQIYEQVIEYYLDYLNGNKDTLETITETSEYSNVISIPKIKSFVFALYSILKACIKFCQVLKVLTGKNNISLKFTVIKKEIDKLIKNHGEWKIQQEKQSLFDIIPLYKQYLKKNSGFDHNKVCRWCFKILTKEHRQHLFCKYIIVNRSKFVHS